MSALRATTGARAIAAWRAWWFPEAPLADLALARIVLAAIVLYLNGGFPWTFLGRFASVGAAPAIAWEPIPLVAALGLEQPTPAQVHVLHRTLQVLLVAVAVGLCTRVALGAALVLQLGLEALLYSFGKVGHGTIPLLYAMLFFTLVPCGGALSVDAWLRRRRAPGTGGGPTPSTSRYAHWPFDLLFAELAFFYFDAGLSKLTVGGLGWADGHTLRYYLVDKQQPLGLWVAERLWLCQALSSAVLALELGFPIGILARRLRPLFLAGGVAFHLGNTLLLQIVFWPVVATYLLFVPWRRLAAVLARLAAPVRLAALRTGASRRPPAAAP